MNHLIGKLIRASRRIVDNPSSQEPVDPRSHTDRRRASLTAAIERLPRSWLLTSIVLLSNVCGYLTNEVKSLRQDRLAKIEEQQSGAAAEERRQNAITLGALKEQVRNQESVVYTTKKEVEESRTQMTELMIQMKITANGLERVSNQLAQLNRTNGSK